MIQNQPIYKTLAALNMTEIERRGFCILLILLLAVLPGCTSAQASSNMLESRISRLEADNYQLRSPINQL